MAPKMIAILVKDLRQVVGVLTRNGGAVPKVEEYAKSGIAVRDGTTASSVTVPVERLELKELDFAEDLLLNPHQYSVDANANRVAHPDAISGLALTASQLRVTFDGPPNATGKYYVRVESDSLAQPFEAAGEVDFGASPWVLPGNFQSGSEHKIYAAIAGHRPMIGVTSF